MTLSQIIDAVRSLSPQEQASLRRAMDCLTAQSDLPADHLDDLLLRDGLLESVPPPVADPDGYENWKPVPISGKPLSETIIEERR